LKECFDELPDPRVIGRTTHRLVDILVQPFQGAK
jgi:hypothetical protein